MQKNYYDDHPIIAILQTISIMLGSVGLGIAMLLLVISVFSYNENEERVEHEEIAVESVAETIVVNDTIYIVSSEENE